MNSMNCETLVLTKSKRPSQPLALILSRRCFSFLLVSSCDLGELGSWKGTVPQEEGCLLLGKFQLPKQVSLARNMRTINA